MTNLDFLFVMNNPGSLKAALPVIQALSSSLLLYSEALAPLVPEGIQKKLIPNPDDLNQVSEILKKHRPKILITGNSVPHRSGGQLELAFRKEAARLKITTVVILDHWCNYRSRFFPENEPCFPNWICVMDERAKQEMIQVGIPEAIIKVTGQPAFDEVLRSKSTIPELRTKIRSQLGISEDQQLVGFVSEPILEDHGDERCYSQFEALDDLRKILDRSQKLWVRLHPRDDPTQYDPSLSYANAYSAREFVAACDVVIGMTSILLFEAYLLGIPTLSYQPNATSSDASVLTSHPLPCALNTKELKKFLENPLKFDSTFYTETQATRQVIDFLNDMGHYCEKY